MLFASFDVNFICGIHKLCFTSLMFGACISWVHFVICSSICTLYFEVIQSHQIVCNKSVQEIRQSQFNDDCLFSYVQGIYGSKEPFSVRLFVSTQKKAEQQTRLNTEHYDMCIYKAHLSTALL